MDAKSLCRGVVLGGLIGDCYGFPYERRFPVDVRVPVKMFTDTISGAETKKLIYSSDMLMNIGLLQSIRREGKFVPEDVAKQFTDDFFSEGENRRYGKNIRDVFRHLRSHAFDDPYKYGAAQFNGTGSFGNGGAMRVSCLAIYALKLPLREFETLVINATRITHTHPLGILGALLQAFAVRRIGEAVTIRGSQPDLGRRKFLDDLLKDLSGVSNSFIDLKADHWKDAYKKYVDKFSEAKKLLRRKYAPSPSDVAKTLGSNLTAIDSVPTAIYAFLQSLKPIPGIELKSILLRCLAFVIAIGDDTDTIGTMACSLVGGYVGLPESIEDACILEKLLKRCERVDKLEEYVAWLADRLTSS